MVLRWVRCAIVMVALSAFAPIGRAATLAYDGFDYSTSSGLNGNNGGVGFGSNAWTQDGSQPNPALATGSLTYTSGSASLQTVGNKLQPGVTSRSFRNFPSPIATSGQTLWVSFRANNTATTTLPSNHAGFHLSAATGGTGAYIFLGKPGFSRTNWGIDLNGTHNQKTGNVTTADRNAFLVYKLVFTGTQLTASMWINKPLTGGEAALGSPDLVVGPVAHSTSIASMNVSLGSNAANYQFDEFRLGTTLADVVPAAVLLAYDGFDYAVGGLNGNNGGTGFGSNAWTQSGTQPNPAIVSGSMSYTSGSDSLATVGNKLQPAVNARSYRNFPSTITTAGQTLWVSFRANNTDTATLPSNHAGFHLSAATGGTGGYIFLGKPGFSRTNWGIDLNGTHNQKTGNVTAADRDAFLVYKLVFTGTQLTASMWIDKPLTGGEAGLGSPDLTVGPVAHSTNIASMNVSIGGNAANYQFDEFRLGTSFETVAPTGGTPPQQDPPAEDIVLFAANATNGPSSGWQKVADPAAGGGFKMYLPEAGSTQSTALASPTHYFEMTFNAPANVPYRLWVRLKADSNSWTNDGVFVQFNNSTFFGGGNAYRIGSTTAANVRLEEASGRPINGWGWQGNGFGPRIMGDAIIFNTSGTQTVRVQKNDDGVAVDRIVLSPSYNTFFGKRPGAMHNDVSTLASANNGIAPAARPASSLHIVEANIHKYRTTQENGSLPDRTISELAAFDADIIGTNETESNYGSTLESRLQLKTGIDWNVKYDGAGNMIFSRYPLTSSETKTYTAGGTAVRAKITVNGRPFHFWVTHHHADDSGIRNSQRTQLLGWAAALTDAPSWFIGDYNVSPGSSELNSTKVDYTDTWVSAVNGTVATAYPPDNPLIVAPNVLDNSDYFNVRTRRNRLDYVWMPKSAAGYVTVTGGHVPDLRDPGTFQTDPNGDRNDAGDLNAIGLWTGTSPASMELDTRDDMGIRVSDHNWMHMKYNVAAP